MNISTTFKRIAIALSIAVIPFISSAFEYNGLHYSYNWDEPPTVTLTYEKYQNDASTSPAYPNLSGAVTIPPTVTNYGETYTVTAIDERAFYNCSAITSLSIPNTVTEIGDYALHNCSGLTSLTIPTSVEFIGWMAFSDCTGLQTVNWNAKSCTFGEHEQFGAYIPFNHYTSTQLTSMIFGNEVEVIPVRLCSGAEGITSVTIPESVKKIGGAAFSGSGLTSIELPSSVTEMGNSAFYSCANLTSANLTNAKLTKIANYTFEDCSSLKTINIPESVKEIGKYAFKNSGLVSVTIPKNVNSIGEYAFSNSKELKYATINDNTCEIGKKAFSGCTSIIHILTYANPANITLKEDVFENVNKTYCVVHVLPDFYDAYKNADQWCLFIIIVPDLSGVEGVEVDESAKEVDCYYDLKGVRLEEPARGQAVIVRYTDGTAKKIVN